MTYGLQGPGGLTSEKLALQVRFFRPKNNTHTSFYTAWPVCEARALPIDLSGKRVEPAPVHRFDYHGG